MTTSKTIRSVPTGALRTDDEKNLVVFKNIYAIVVWRNDDIAWFDVYTKSGGYYLGKVKDLYYLCR